MSITVTRTSENEDLLKTFKIVIQIFQTLKPWETLKMYLEP